MIPMLIDRPLREDQVGLLGFEQPAKTFVMVVIDDSTSVDLLSEYGSRSKDFTSFCRLCRSNRSALLHATPAAETFTSIQIKQNDFVPQSDKSRDGAGASAFRISRMSARNNDFEPTLREACHCDAQQQELPPRGGSVTGVSYP